MFKCSRLKWAEHLARMKESRNVFKILTCKPLGRPRLDMRTELEWILNK